MKLISLYLIALLVSLTYLIVLNLFGQLIVIGHDALQVGVMCALIGGIGGCIYCLQAIYLNACVRKQWNKEWAPWYYIRPIVSIACGGVSYLFLRAGLLILESGTQSGSTDLGFYALAFIAGLNVDKFISKIEDIAQAVWGIEKSRATTDKLDTSSR
jgi:hypothetical protein